MRISINAKMQLPSPTALPEAIFLIKPFALAAIYVLMI